MGPSGDIAAAWMEAGGIVAGVRQAGASSFSQEAISTPGDQVSYPSAAVNASGAVVVAWIDSTAEQYEVAIRPPEGTFSAPIEAGPTGGGLQQETSVAIDGAGDVLVGEIDYTGGVNGHYVAAYAWQPAGGAFAVTPVSEPTSEANTPVVAMDGVGDAVVAWEDNMGGAHLVARAITRPAAGPFGPTENLSDSSEYAFDVAAAIGGAGQAAVAWEYGNPSHVHIEASTSAGPADLLSVPQTISMAGGNGEYPAIGVGGNGEVVAAWAQQGATNTDDVASAPAGGSFGPAVEVGSMGDPQVAMDGTGDAVIAWGASQAGVESVNAVTRSASGVLGPVVTLSAPEENVDSIFANVPAASVGMDSAGDAIAGWGRASDHTVQARLYTSPTLAPGAPASPAPTFIQTGPPALHAVCVVPRLKGLSSTAAKRRLLAAHCELGKLRIAKRYRHANRLVVASQSFKAGRILAYRASVSLTLRPPPAHRKKHHPR